MSFDTYNDNNEDKDAKKSPYGPPTGHAQGQGGNPDAGWGPAQPQQNPYGFPAPQQNQPFAGQAPQNAPSNPYNFNQAQQPAPASNGKPLFMGLTWEKNIVRNPETNGMPPAAPKSVGLAYVLWFFLGWIGVHQFYLGNTSRGLVNLILFFSTAILSGILGGLPIGIIYTAYWIYEAVTLNDQTNEVNQGFIRKSIL